VKVTQARIVYHGFIANREGERIKGIGWAYEPLLESGMVKMLNREAVEWPDVPPLDTGERLCKHTELGAYYLVQVAPETLGR
jgi:hypothetical protein